MRYVLRYNQQELELAVGEFLIGRASSCQLSLDDPLVSRNHAVLTVRQDGVTIEDLGSRNGVKVNGERLTAPRRLVHGDVIVIGNQELKFATKRDVPTDTLVQAPTQRSASFGLMGLLADKALALGRGEEAERLIRPSLEQLLGELENGKKCELEQVRLACDYAVKLASLTGNAEWVDYIFRAYATTKRPCAAELIDHLYDVLRKVREPSLTGLRKYLDVLHREVETLGPAERFLLGRLEGLERVIAAR